MFRVLLILGVLVLVPAAIVFWHLRDRTAVTQSSPPLSQKIIGTSTVSHGSPDQGNGFASSPNRSERRSE